MAKINKASNFPGDDHVFLLNSHSPRVNGCALSVIKSLDGIDFSSFLKNFQSFRPEPQRGVDGGGD